MRYYSRTEPVGWTYHASIYCATCAEHLPSVDPEGNDKNPVFAWDEIGQEIDGEFIWYSCDSCGESASDW